MRFNSRIYSAGVNPAVSIQALAQPVHQNFPSLPGNLILMIGEMRTIFLFAFIDMTHDDRQLGGGRFPVKKVDIAIHQATNIPGSCTFTIADGYSV